LTITAGYTGRDVGGFSGLAKTIIAVQAMVNLFLSAWVYEEYRNNVSFQAYVNSTLATPVPTTTLLSVVAVFMISGGLLGGRKSRLRKIRMGLAPKKNTGGPPIASVSQAGTVKQQLSGSSPVTRAVVSKGTEIMIVMAQENLSSQMEAGKPLERKSQ